MLSEKTIDVVKQTAPILGEHAETLTRMFYKRMFANNPEVRPFFNPAHQVSGRQQQALAGAIVAYASHIDQLDALGPAVELIAHKHASLGVKAEHYPIVGENLLAAIKELLGDAATDEIIDAWAEAYGFLADILIQREGQLYDEHEARHGWTGFRTFRVADKVDESDEITSFHLEPTDGSAIGPHQPGQYLTLRLPSADPEQGETTMRNYSISVGPNERRYRISVKREPAASADAPHGHASNLLHDRVEVGDELEIGPPCGEFILDVAAESENPLVLISGGVGITPLLSMLHAVVEAGVDREVHFIHAARNGRVHAFADEVRQLAERHGRVHVHICYDEPTDDDRAAGRFDTEGRVDLSLLKRVLPSPAGDFYFCGPMPFMHAVGSALKQWGVDDARIHYECFGPLQPLGASDPRQTSPSHA